MGFLSSAFVTRLANKPLNWHVEVERPSTAHEDGQSICLVEILAGKANDTAICPTEQADVDYYTIEKSTEWMKKKMHDYKHMWETRPTIAYEEILIKEAHTKRSREVSRKSYLDDALTLGLDVD